MLLISHIRILIMEYPVFGEHEISPSPGAPFLHSEKIKIIYCFPIDIV